MSKNTLLADLNDAKAELAKIKDELKLQLHLGKAEASAKANAQWQKVEPAIAAAEKKLNDAAARLAEKTDEARVQAHLGIADVKQGWPSLETIIHEVVAEAKRVGDAVEAKVDTARVQANLGAKDAAVTADKAGVEFRAEMNKLGAELDRETEAAVAELKSGFAGLKKKLGF